MADVSPGCWQKIKQCEEGGEGCKQEEKRLVVKMVLQALK